jgi:hypothetical protein
MTQAERNRLVALKKAKKKLISQNRSCPIKVNTRMVSASVLLSGAARARFPDPRHVRRPICEPRLALRA